MLAHSIDKFCPRCSTYKPLDKFYKSSSCKDGLRVYCKACTLAVGRKSYYKNHEASIERQHVGRQNIKQEVLTHYGGSKLACVHCGFSDMRALSIDHIAGGGTKHKHTLGRTGTAFYRWLQSQGYPEGYQVLCMNCQFIKKREEREYGGF